MAVAGTLEIQLLANIARLQSDMTQAKGAVGSAMKSIESSVAMAKSALGALGIGLGVGYFARFLKGIIDTQDELSKLSQKLNIPVEQLAGLRHAADLAGVSGEALTKGFKTLTSQMFDASMGLAESKRNFGLLGIEVKKTDGTLRDTQAVMLQVADKFAGMQDGAAKSALAVKLFGKAGLDMIPLLNEGSAAIARMIAEGQRLNPVTAESAKQAEIFNDNMTRVSGTLKQGFIEAMNKAMPGIADISEAMAQAAKDAGFWAAALVGLGGVISKVFQLPEIQKANKEFADLTDRLMALQDQRDKINAAERGGVMANLRAMGLGTLADADKRIAAVTARLAELQKIRDAFGKDAPTPAKALATLSIPDDAALKKAAEALARYRKEMLALGIKSEEAYLLAVERMREEQDTNIREELLKHLADEKTAREKNARGDAEAMAARTDAFEAMQIAIGQIELAELNRREAAEIASAKRAEDLRKDQEKEITRGLTDALMRGFDAGKGFARNFWDSMVAMAKTVVLRPIIEGVLSPISSAVSSGIGSLLGGGGLIGDLLTGFRGTSLAANLAGPTTAGATGAMGIGSMLGAIPGWGWAATGGLALLSGLFGGGGGPKNPYLGLTRSSAGLSMVTQADFGDTSLNAAQAQELNLWLQQLPPRLQTAIDGMVVSLSPGATPQQAWEQLHAQITATAQSLNLTTEELKHLGSIAEQTADIIANTAANDAILSELSRARDAVWQAYDTEADKLRTLADSMAGFGKSLRELAQEFATGEGSTLAPMARLAAVQSQFRDLARRAQLGDAEALGALGASARDYRQLGRGAYASGDAFNAIDAEIRAALGVAAGTAERTADNATQQVSLLQTQVEQLVGIRVGVLSLAQTMAGVADVMATGSLSGTGGTVNLWAGIGWARSQIAGGNARGVYDLLVANGMTATQFDLAMGYSAGTSNAWARSQGLPAFQMGTDYVPRTGLAVVHQGESITPAGGNAALVSEVRALREEVRRLTAVVATGESANVEATNRVAQTQRDTAWRAEVRPKAA